MQLEISLALEPIRSNLEAMLADLEELFHRGRFARQDLHILRGELSSERGQWADAIAHFERGFAAFVDDDEPGFTKRTCSSWAASACLAERRLAAAQDWIEAMQDMSEWGSGWDKSIRVWQAYYRLRLARARCAPFSELRSLLREFDDVMYGQDGAIAVDNLYIERARVGILDPQGGDPARPTHQSRNACRDYPIRRSNCHSRFDRSLLVVDYRLACLRFAVGIGPVDDEFDKTSPPLVKLIPPDGRDFGQRLDKAGAALRRARECATQLDAMLECDWRTKEVEARAIWIRAIGAAAAG